MTNAHEILPLEGQQRPDGRDVVLFNCCYQCVAPDWTLYASLSLGGCKTDPEDDGQTLGNMTLAESEFFTVYGITPEGYAEAITDIGNGASMEEAITVMGRLSGLSGLPSRVHPILSGDAQ